MQFQNSNDDKNNELLPKNSDDMEQNNNQDVFNKIDPREQYNLKQININKLNIENIKRNVSNQKYKMNSKNKSSERSYNDVNDKNKTVPNFNNNNNLNVNAGGINRNIKRIIHRTKNMKNSNYSNLNKNTYNNINNMNLIPNDNNGRIKKKVSNSNDKIEFKNNMSISNGNKTDMNINYNIMNNNIKNNLYKKSNEDIRNHSKNNYQGPDPINYMPNKRPSYNVKNKMHSFNNLNQIELNKKSSYNNTNNNISYLTQIGINKRPSYNNNFNVSKFLNNNNIPMVGGYTQIKKLNNHDINKMQIQNNLGINSTNLQEGQLIQNNTLNPNSIIGGRSHLINVVNLNNPSANLIVYKNNKNKSLIDTQEIHNVSLKKNKMMANKNYYYLTDYNIQKNRNISAEIKDKPNLFLEQYQNNYISFQKQLGNIYTNTNNNLQYDNYGNYFG